MKDRTQFFEDKLKGLYEELDLIPIQDFFDNNHEEKEPVKKLIAEIKRLETIKKDREKESQLKKVNKSQAEKRSVIKDLLKVEFPKEDIRTNSGEFHSVKLKKYASLAEFMTLHPDARFSYDYEKKTYTLCRLGGYSYNINKPIYENSTTAYERFTDFESCLEWHGILLKEMSFKEFKKREAAIFKECERIKKEIEKSDSKLKELNVYFLSNENLIRRSDRRSYEYFTI